MDRQYLRSSSLARKFFEDFPDSSNMPLQFMTKEHHEAYDRNVLPLLQLFNSSPDLANCYNAVQQLRTLILKNKSTYELSRAAAEYVQSPFALCILDSAAACSVNLQAASFCSALASCDSMTYRELLVEDIRRRFVANGLGDLTESLAVQLDKHPAVAAARPHPSDLDRLVLPAKSVCNKGSRSTCLSAILANQTSDGDQTAPSIAPAAAPPHKNTITTTTTTTSSSSSSAGEQLQSAGDDGSVAEASILKRAAWRRQLSRFSSHYLSSILGKDGPGTVVLTGSIIPDIISGNTQQQSMSSATAAASDSGSSSSSVCHLSFVGYSTAAEAQGAFDGCFKELLSRWFMRHPTKILTPQGNALLPLAVATQHHLLLLLPEPTQPLLPAAVQVDAAALAAAVDHGAFEGPAVVAAAADGGQTAMQCSNFRDVMFSFDLALHPSMEALLLGAAAVAGSSANEQPAAGCSVNAQDQTKPSNSGLALLHAAANALNAFAYDGDDVYALPSAVRAMASGKPLLDPAAVMDLERSSQHDDYDAALGGESSQAAAAAAGSSGCSVDELMTNPSFLRAVLDYRHEEQQQQQPAGETSAQQVDAAAEGQGGLSAVEQQRLIQQLNRDCGWVWGLVERPSTAPAPAGAAGHDAPQQPLQQQQLGMLPDCIAQVVADRWWKGPVMQGSVLYGSVFADT